MQMIWELLKIASTLYTVFALPSVLHLQCISKVRYILSNFQWYFKLYNKICQMQSPSQGLASEAVHPGPCLDYLLQMQCSRCTWERKGVAFRDGTKTLLKL